MDVFVSTQSRLLDLEREAEVAQSQDQFATSDFKDKSHFNRLVLKGSAIKDVVIDSSRTGLFGRTQFTFKHKIPSNPLPANSFSNGKLVCNVYIDHHIHKQAITRGPRPMFGRVIFINIKFFWFKEMFAETWL